MQSKTLGIFVSSDKHLDKIIGICKAANKKKVSVHIFYTHLGVLLTQNEKFSELEGLAEMSVCNVSIEKNALTAPIPGILEKNYATQSRHGIMIHDCDRYLVF